MTVTTLEAPSVPSRCLHVLDLENLMEGSLSVAGITDTWRKYLTAGLIGPNDQVFVGCGATYAPWAVLGLVNAPLRLVVGGYGPDAADIALLETLPASWVYRRFDRVVIGSADHGFAPWASDLVDHGLQVLQVLPSKRPSRILGGVVTASLRLGEQATWGLATPKVA